MEPKKPKLIGVSSAGLSQEVDPFEYTKLKQNSHAENNKKQIEIFKQHRVEQNQQAITGALIDLADVLGSKKAAKTQLMDIVSEFDQR